MFAHIKGPGLRLLGDTLNKVRVIRQQNFPSLTEFCIRGTGKLWFPHLTIPPPPSSFQRLSTSLRRKRESIHQPAVKKIQSPCTDTIGEALPPWMSGETVGGIRCCTMDSRLRRNNGMGKGTDCSW